MKHPLVYGCLLVPVLLFIAMAAPAQGRSNSTLPVMFDNVRISLKNGAVLVEWSNLTERELIDYVIERSPDAKIFTEVSRFKPRSNDNEPESYSDVDPSPLPGLNYYRIRVNEMSGKIIYSIILKIETTTESTDLSLYPNPVTNGRMTWSVSNLPAGSYRLQIVSMGGVPVSGKTIRIAGSGLTETIDLPKGIPAGSYRLLLRGETSEQSRGFMVQ